MAKNDEFLTFEEAYRIFNYDCFTGELRWSDNLSDLEHLKCRREHFRGKIAGFKSGRHMQVFVKGKNHMVHRVAWLMTYEKWPDGEIDHEKGGGFNNRITNLRDVSHSCNMKNSRARAGTKSGVSGVEIIRRKFRAAISVNGKRLHLGMFDTIEEAAAARQSANEEHGYHPLHGTVK